MLSDKKLDDIKGFKNISTLVMFCLLLFSGILITTPASGAKVYHCLQPNGTKAFQGRPCEKDKKTVAVTEQKNSKRASNETSEEKDSIEKFSVIGKWTLKGISSTQNGELQTQEEKISWSFFDNGKVTYQYEDSSNIYDYTLDGKTINMPNSPNKSFEIIKNDSSSAIWKTGTTYYFLAFTSAS